jgi:hypothetical protein
LYGGYVQAVGCGYGHALLIIRSDSDEDKEKIEKINVFKP